MGALILWPVVGGTKEVSGVPLAPTLQCSVASHLHLQLDIYVTVVWSLLTERTPELI